MYYIQTVAMHVPNTYLYYAYIPTNILVVCEHPRPADHTWKRGCGAGPPDQTIYAKMHDATIQSGHVILQL